MVGIMVYGRTPINILWTMDVLLTQTDQVIGVIPHDMGKRYKQIAYAGRKPTGGAG